MNENEIGSSFSNLSLDQKTYLLSSLAHQLTVCARGSYPDQSENRDKKLQAFNEIGHSVTGQLMHILAKDNKWYSDNDLIGIVFEKARGQGVENELIWAFTFSLQPLLV